MNAATIAAVSPHVLVCLLALGMALAFISADRDSPTSRALAVGFAFIGIAIDLNIVVPMYIDIPLSARGWFALPEAVAMIAIFEWVLRVRGTVPTRDMDTRTGDGLLRLGQALAVVYAMLSVVFSETRSTEFLGALDEPGALARSGFWLFAAPILFGAITGLMSIVLLLRRRPDSPERLRVLAMAGAIPFMIAGFVVPLDWSPLAMILGEVIFLIGAVHYHVLQGSRGQFMAQFLSPQVAEMVRDRGLKQAMQQNYLEVSIVCCDLRGFTAVAEGTSSTRVIRVLREYYDAVGNVVAEFGGTIKDQAGDGILVLVGAPIPVSDHATRALQMARRIHVVGKDLKTRWSAEGIWLGLGIGVASGHVTVGILGARTRLEYTAVGAPVNLAARLCHHALDGEILVAQRTIELCGARCADEWTPRAPVSLKGFAEPVAHYAG